MAARALLCGCTFIEGTSQVVNRCDQHSNEFNFPDNGGLAKALEYEEITRDRTRVYGDPKISHRAIGYVWRGILQNRFQEIEIPVIPEDLVAIMLAAFKTVRAARPVMRKDSYDDGHIYLKFSEEFRKDI